MAVTYEAPLCSLLHLHLAQRACKKAASDLGDILLFGSCHHIFVHSQRRDICQVASGRPECKPGSLPCRSAFSEEFSDAGGFGWKASKPDFDWPHLMNKKVSSTSASLWPPPFS